MLRIVSFSILCTATILSLLSSCGSGVPDEISTAYSDLPKQVDFNFHIRPILSDRCYACHGPDKNARKAELRLDLEEHAFAALKDSEDFAIVPGKPMQSVAVHRILSDDPDLVMPPPESEMHLTEVEKAMIYKWIKQGAEWKSTGHLSHLKIQL